MFDNYHSTFAHITTAHPLLGHAMTVHRNTRGQPLSFVDKPSLIELYCDMPKFDDFVCCKAVQTGLSELMVQYALRRSGWDGRITAYILPTSKGRNRFVQSRIDPLLQVIPEYRIRTPQGSGRKKGAENLQMKEFGAGRMLFLGSNSAVDFLEFSADIMVIDELDGCDPKNLSKARNRLRASPYPQLIRLGNPTVPGVGIAKLYNESDSRLYHHKCNHCGEWQPIDWFVNVVERSSGGKWVPRDTKRWRGLQSTMEVDPDPRRDIRPVCRRCHDPFERGALPGLWVDEYPSRHLVGYRMTRLDVLYPSQSLWGLMLEWLAAQGDTALLATFYCDVLGFPFIHAGKRLSVEDLQAALHGEDIDYGGGDYLKDELVTMGVDVGAVLNVQISKVCQDKDEDGNAVGPPRREGVFVGAFRTFGEVQDAIERYHVDCCVIDERPEIHKASEVRDWAANNTYCQVWLARFQHTPRAGREKFALKLDFSSRIAVCDRTSLCDASVDDIRSGAQLYPADSFTVLSWSPQMRAPTRRLNEEKQRIVWEEDGKADHYFFANCYDRMAYELVQRTGSLDRV